MKLTLSDLEFYDYYLLLEFIGAAILLADCGSADIKNMPTGLEAVTSHFIIVDVSIQS